MYNCLLWRLLTSRAIGETMSQVEIHDLTDSDDGKQIVSSRSLSRLNNKQGSSAIFGGSGTDYRLHIPVKRRQVGYDEYPNFERQYIQNINIPTAAQTGGDSDGASRNHDDNYHFLMSLLPYLREVPKNRKMVVRHKLQKVFVEELERKTFGKHIHSNHQSSSHFPRPFANPLMTGPSCQPQQIPTIPPPPYPCKQKVVYNYGPAAAVAGVGASASVPLPNASASASKLLGNILGHQQPIFPENPVPVGLPSEYQQYYNAPANKNSNNNNNNNNNKSSFGYNATVVDNNNANNKNNKSSFGHNATSVDNNNGNTSYFGYNANNNANNISLGYNATAMDNNNANNNNNSYLGYNATAVQDSNKANNNNNNSYLGYNAQDSNNSSLSYNATTVDNDNISFPYHLEVTGEPQTFTNLG